jgi:uncharacterized membrane protein
MKFERNELRMFLATLPLKAQDFDNNRQWLCYSYRQALDNKDISAETKERIKQAVIEFIKVEALYFWNMHTFTETFPEIVKEALRVK